MKKSLVLNLLIGVLCLCQFAIAAEDQWQGVERIVAVGDIHGDYDNYIQVLRDAGLVNRRGNWIAGESHFVQLGDLPDRGPDTDKIIAHMKKLEIQAAADGGRVHALIGNHEAMNIYGDLRYVDPGEYEALKSRDARPLRNAMYALHLQQLQAANPEFKVEEDYREKFDAQYPLGFVEHRRNWDVRHGEFGSWVAEHNAVIKINRTLFLHGGISPQYVQMSLAEINEQVRSELAGNLLEDKLGASEAEDGPLWYRGLANNDELLEKAHLEGVLVKYDVDHIVIGHTPGLGTIVPRFGGKVLVIDSGISKSYGGHLASLLIENGKLKTLQEGKEIALPEENAGLFAYYQSILALGSNTVALQRLVDSMQQEP